MSEQAANTDRELWRAGGGDGNGMSYYEPSLHVTAEDLIGINVGGTVLVLPIEKWHHLAAADAGLLCEWCKQVIVPFGPLCANCRFLAEEDERG
jgi:hypothetical protein